MNTTQTTERILALLHGVVGGDKAERLGIDSRLLDEGCIDSFGLVSLVAEIESVFSISVSTGDLTAQNFQSVRDIVRMVEHYLGTEQTPSPGFVHAPREPTG